MQGVIKYAILIPRRRWCDVANLRYHQEIGRELQPKHPNNTVAVEAGVSLGVNIW